jgi:Cu(I)/Ag(I) efflux system membrane fusion protein
MLVGCGKKAAQQAAPAGNQAANESQEANITVALNELSPDDRLLAVKQKFCPVSGMALGAMGKPEKVEVKGQAVFLCCDGCRQPLIDEPDKYLAKLNAPAEAETDPK